MAYAVINSANNDSVTITIYDLQYPAYRYDNFMWYLDSTRMGYDKRSDSSSNTISLTLDISKTYDGRTSMDGRYRLYLKTVFNGSEYDLSIKGDNTIVINRGGSEPQPNTMTWIKILEIQNAEDYYARLKIRTNGYGDLYFISITKAWDLYNGTMGDYSFRVHTRFISPQELNNGYFEGYVEFSFTETDLSYFPSVPVGTCYLASGRSLNGRYFREYDYLSRPFICMSQYNRWEIYRGTYSTTLSDYHNALVADVNSLGSVYKDWLRLINMSFYLESTTYGTIKYTQYSSYIPKQGDIITAGMYNALLNSVIQCLNQVGTSTSGLPNPVGSGDIISQYFIYDIGRVVDSCLQQQRDRTNFNAIDRY